jgi:hypothetical protein
MNRIFVTFCIASALSAVSAFAQYDRPYGDRDYARQDRGLFDKARMDLDHASTYPYASRADRKRFDEARGKLFDFESRFDQGRYDKHELDGAIDRLQHVVESNSLDPRDRGSLSDDLRRMRDYREFRNHHGDYGYGYR